MSSLMSLNIVAKSKFGFKSLFNKINGLILFSCYVIGYHLYNKLAFNRLVIDALTVLL